MINSFIINISKPIPIETAPTFASGFQDLLESELKYWLILNKLIDFMKSTGGRIDALSIENAERVLLGYDL